MRGAQDVAVVEDVGDDDVKEDGVEEGDDDELGETTRAVSLHEDGATQHGKERPQRQVLKPNDGSAPSVRY